MIKKLLLVVALTTTTFIFAQTGPTKAWVTMPADNAVLTVGDVLSLSASYDAGDDGGEPLSEYTVGGSTLDHVQFAIIAKKTGESNIWGTGINDAATGGTHSGTASKNLTVPDVTPSVELADGYAWYVRVSMQNSVNAWASGGDDIPITIEPREDWDFNPSSPTFTSQMTTLDVPITYTSDMDIAVGGLKFTMWTITEGPFSDIWHGAFSNSSVLTAGINESATITINIPAGVKDGDGYMRPSTDLGAIWDPNDAETTGDYVDYATSNPSAYYYQFRKVSGTDANFTAHSIGGSVAFTVEVAAGIEGIGTKNVTVYPNPTTGNINISNLDGVNSISITNIAGQVIAQFGAQSSIDVSELPSGIYILQTNTGLKRKIVKK